MTMRKVRGRAVALAGTAAIAAAGLSMLGSHAVSAGYTNSCSAAFSGQTHYESVGTVHVYEGNGRTGQAGVAAGVCTDGSASLPGGDLEGGVSGSHGQIAGQQSVAGHAIPGAYLVLDGCDGGIAGTCNNPQVGAVGTTGYVGVSNFETGSYDAQAQDFSSCGGDGATAGGSNSGGGVNFKNATTCGTVHTINGLYGNDSYGLPLPIACGFNSGPDWDNTPRDGCFFP